MLANDGYLRKSYISQSAENIAEAKISQLQSLLGKHLRNAYGNLDLWSLCATPAV